jgi:uncharacterized Zn finger protein (UPF0148 family)
MLNYKKYIDAIKKAEIFELTCPNCGALTRYTKGKSVFCNFCEQYINISEAEIANETGVEIQFAEVSAAIREGAYEEAEKKAALLSKGKKDPELMYLSALAYLCISDAAYHETDYNLRGFMEQNSDNIRRGLDLTSKWKEYFYKAIKIVKYEIGRDVAVDGSLLFVKFMSEIRLKRFVDAEKTLKLLHGSGIQSDLSEYADMVYNVEAGRPVAERVLPNLLSKGEMNSFYYLAKHLAMQSRLDEAETVAKWLNRITNMCMAKELSRKIESTQKASEF